MSRRPKFAWLNQYKLVGPSKPSKRVEKNDDSIDFYILYLTVRIKLTAAAVAVAAAVKTNNDSG